MLILFKLLKDTSPLEKHEEHTYQTMCTPEIELAIFPITRPLYQEPVLVLDPLSSILDNYLDSFES